MPGNDVRQLQVVLTSEDLDAALAFYRDVAGSAGSAGTVRLAFEVPDTAGVAEALSASGRQDVGPGGMHVTVFAAPGSVGRALASLGGEPGALGHVVDLARTHGASGQLPFAALVVRDGVVVGAGVNTALADGDPSAHAEVTAIRDAGRRAGSGDLTGAVVYSSCEPCAICRAVAAAAGVREIVFAAGTDLVPPAMDPAPQTTAALIDAVTGVLPRIARRGDSSLTTAELTAPFRAYLAYLEAVAP
jgi:pyrimidine deaminase RibD-like protein